MPSSDHKAALQQIIHRSNAAISSFARIESELRSIRKGLMPTDDKTRLDNMIRLNRETLAAMEKRLANAVAEVARLDCPR